MKVRKQAALCGLLFLFYTAGWGQGGFKVHHFLQGSFATKPYQVFESPNGNFVILGLTYDTLHGKGFNELTLVGTDPAGQFLWRKDYGSYKWQYLDWGGGLHEKDSSHFYFTFWLRDSLMNQMGVFLKFDYNGDTLWQRVFRDPAMDVAPTSLVRSVDGGFLLTGMFQDWVGNTRPLLVLKTDGHGQELWRKKITKSNPNVQNGVSIAQDKVTKRIAIVGYMYIPTCSLTNAMHTVLDSSGNQIFHGTQSNCGAGPARKVISLKDGNFLSSACWLDYSIGNADFYQRMLVKFDPGGKIIWSK